MMSEKYNLLGKMIKKMRAEPGIFDNLPETTKQKWWVDFCSLFNAAIGEKVADLAKENSFLREELILARQQADFWFEQLNKELIRQQQAAEHRQKLDLIIAHSKDRNLDRDIEILFGRSLATPKREPFDEELLNLLEIYAKPAARAVVKNVIECGSKSKTRSAYKSTDKSVSKKGARSRSVAGAKTAPKISKQAGVKKE